MSPGSSLYVNGRLDFRTLEANSEESTYVTQSTCSYYAGRGVLSAVEVRTM